MNIIAQNLLLKEQNGDFIKQLTTEWYQARQNMFTASEIACILECNIYQTKYDIFVKKLSPIEHIDNEATEWGNMFEATAIEFYEFLTQEKVHSLGLIKHPKYEWIGASPDGLLLSGKLLEIKCPIRRNIEGLTPLYYWIQMQIQMEVCDIDSCDYFECKFYKYENKAEYDIDINSNDTKGALLHKNNTVYYKLLNTSLKTITRDKKWFYNVIDVLKTSYDELKYYQSLSNGLNKLKDNVKKNYKRKKNETISYDRKKIKSNNYLIEWKDWVSATKIRNYMIGDPIIDWLDLYPEKVSCFDSIVKKKHQGQFTFQQYIMKQGLAFEQRIIKEIQTKFSNEFICVADYQEARSYDKYIETINHIKAGVPIIYQGVLHDYKRKIFGMPDLLVRHDYLNKIFDIPITTHTYKNTQYRVVEIKHISLELCSDGKHLRNNKNIYAYKGQLYIYNKILGNVQGTAPTKSYILGKTWCYKKSQQIFKGGPFERVAHVNFKTVDGEIRKKTADSIKWIRDVKTNGSSWDLYSRDELKPNMCNIDNKYQSIKTEIAKKYNDITLLWMCGTKNRKIAESNGVINWKTFNNLLPETLGITGDKISNTLLTFIEMNQDTVVLEPYTPKNELDKEWLIHPLKIKSNMFDWKETKEVELFIDFETITPDVYPSMNIQSPFIFMIGVGIIINGEWNFRCFKARGLSLDDERLMLLEFHNYIDNIRGNRSIYHWGNAEQYLYKNAINRHYQIVKDIRYITEWCDLLKLFKEESIVSRGMLNFSLKSVVKAFYDNCFIDTNYDDNDVMNGLDAMIMAINCYNINDINGFVMDNIQSYNEVDCKVIWEILTYLRKNH